MEALRGVDLDLMPGEVHALVGDNGAGKSTLVKIIAGAIQATEGEILLDGRRVNFTEPSEALAAGISTVYQSLALVGCRSIAANLFLGREPSRFGFVRSREMNAKAEQMLTDLRQLNITEIHAEVDDLSGGQRQAVAIARGVRLGQRVLILDEPTAALGVREAAGVLELIRTLRGTQRTLLLISHNLQHVFDVSDRITVLRAGRKVGTVRREQTTSDQIVAMITGSCRGGLMDGANSVAAPAPTALRRIGTSFLRSRTVALLLFNLVFILAVGLYNPDFLAPDNLRVIVENMALEAIVMVGAVFLLAAGRFDLSVDGSATLSGVVAGLILTNSGLPVGRCLARRVRHRPRVRDRQRAPDRGRSAWIR